MLLAVMLEFPRLVVKTAQVWMEFSPDMEVLSLSIPGEMHSAAKGFAFYTRSRAFKSILKHSIKLYKHALLYTL